MTGAATRETNSGVRKRSAGRRDTSWWGTPRRYKVNRSLRRCQRVTGGSSNEASEAAGCCPTLVERAEQVSRGSMKHETMRGSQVLRAVAGENLRSKSSIGQEFEF